MISREISLVYIELNNLQGKLISNVCKYSHRNRCKESSSVVGQIAEFSVDREISAGGKTNTSNTIKYNVFSVIKPLGRFDWVLVAGGRFSSRGNYFFLAPLPALLFLFLPSLIPGVSSFLTLSISSLFFCIFFLHHIQNGFR
jgi:hypothetical protein